MKLNAVSMPDRTWAFTNKVYVHPDVKRQFGPYCQIQKYVYNVEGTDKVNPGEIATNVTQRKICDISVTAGQNAVEVAKFDKPSKNILMGSGEIHIKPFSANSPPISLEYEDISKSVLNLFEGHVFLPNQPFIWEKTSVLYLLHFKSFEVFHEDTVTYKDASLATYGQLTKDTKLNIKSADQKAVKIANVPVSMMTGNNSDIFKNALDLETLGIGGLSEQFKTIFRRAFASRLLPPALITRLKLNHVKGVLLYGPPGTGKTLIAREIGKLLNCKDIQKIAGPAVLDKYIGESERKIRELFKPAEIEQQEKGDESELHVIIFDEIDALFRQRGSTRDSTGVLDGVVNQLLSKMDGVDALNNILIIGMTNRKDLLDEALLRPGRFEVHIEVGLPNEKGRLEILNIHTRTLRENNMLALQDSELGELAAQAKNYTGGELEGVVKNAFSRAQSRLIDMAHINKNMEIDKLKVTMDDFQGALKENKPKFGCTEMPVFKIVELKVKWWQSIVELFSVMTASEGLSTLLLCGKPGTGKTALACHLAKLSGYSYAKLVSSDQMVALQESTKCADIRKAFDDAYRTEEAVIILDEIETLIEYIGVGPRFSNALAQVLKVLVKKQPEPGRKLLVIGTTSEIDTVQQLGIASCFSCCKNMEELSVSDTESVIRDLGYTLQPSPEQCYQKLPSHMAIKPLITLLHHAFAISVKKGVPHAAEKKIVTADAIEHACQLTQRYDG